MEKEMLIAIKELLEKELAPIKAQLNENTLILRALEHKADTNKAEYDNFTYQLAEISKEIKSGFKEVNDKIYKISSDLLAVEAVTGKNMQNIAYLKAIK